MNPLFQLFTKEKFIIFSISILSVLSVNAQKYWQQEVNYKIHVELNDKKHELTGDETIEYINHSPDELTFIYFHLWPNAYKNDSTALAKQMHKGKINAKLFSNDSYRGFIDSISFKVDGKPVKCESHPEHIDICKIILNSPLPSGGRISIHTPFHIKIPRGGLSRMGHIGQSYQISQWYPKPAVYDSKGWHPIPYLDMGEFYSEFGSFDVSITLPSNYIIGATGELQTPSERKWMNELAQNDSQTDSFPKGNAAIVSDTIMKTIRYTEKNVHDFAWFADKSFRVLKGNVVLPDSKDTVTTWCLFSSHSGNTWKKAPQYIHDAIFYYSKWLGNYPYKNCTALEGPLGAGGGMEYPGITIVSSGDSDYMLDLVITHEVGHNWLYGILGFNERDYPFLDEGINTYYEKRYLDTKYPNLNFSEMLGIPKGVGKFLELNKLPVDMYYHLMYLGPATYRTDQAVTLKSGEFSEANYGLIVYMKTGLCFNYLENYLGIQEYDSIMKKFYKKWKYKHPQPEDLRTIFETNTTKDVSWFFDELLPTENKLDYKICRLHKNQILIRNKGTLSTPVILNGINKDSLAFEKWYPGFKGKKWLPLPDNSVEKIIIDSKYETPELYRYNNFIRTSGLFKKLKPLKLKLLTTLDDYNYTTIQYLPVVAWNSSNHIMAGALIHNGFLLKKPFEYQIMPLYGFTGNKLAGMSKLSYNIFPSFAHIRILSFNLYTKQFAIDRTYNFSKIKLETRAVFKTRDYKFYPRHIVEANYSRITDLKDYINRSYINIFNINYHYQNPKKLNLTKINCNLKANENFARTSVEVVYNIQPQYLSSPITLHLFTGYMISGQNSNSSIPFRLSGMNGVQDAEFDGLFMGRFDSKGLLTHQFMPVEGGFATPYNLYSNQFLFSSGIEFKTASKGLFKLFRIYGNMAYLRPDNMLFKSYDLFYETGIKAGIQDFIEIYFPVIFDKKYIQYHNYSEIVRFNLNLQILNPFNIMERLNSM